MRARKTPQESAEKWSPLTKGLDEPAATATAVVMEQEAAYLSSLSDEERKRQFGDKAPGYIFPLLRRAAPHFAGKAQPEFLDICKKLEETYFEICDAVACRRAEGKYSTFDPPAYDMMRSVFGGIAERMQASLVEYHEESAGR